MIVIASEIEVGKFYTFSQLKDVVRVTSGLVTGDVRSGRFVGIKCLETGAGIIIDLKKITRIEEIEG